MSLYLFFEKMISVTSINHENVQHRIGKDVVGRKLLERAIAGGSPFIYTLVGVELLS